ncbi:DUF853 family protein [Candidatus Pacearchaeota archaeon]|nr:DUF853 family protein [Candidatus Pacearchaeota archaeon]
MKNLQIAKNLSLPLDAVTQTFAILAIRGAGKTNTSVVMVEELLKNGLQVVVADPVGVWWGLRSSADGKSAGQPIVIFGGDHGDVPLEHTGGKLVAELVVNERVSVLLDLSGFRKGEQVRFMTDFTEHLYYLKGKNRDPLHIVFDEADEFAPQRPQKGRERLLGAIEDLVRRGRARGIGTTLITQRSAVLNKNVLTQAEVLVALRTLGPQDRKAIDAWIEAHGTPDERKELMGTLAILATGEAWVWSPGWLDVFKRVKIRRRDTFDSSATPSVMKKIKGPKKFADVNLEEIRDMMASTIEKAKADDPRELKRRIAELERALKKAEAVGPKVEIKEVPILTKENIATIEKYIKEIDGQNDRLHIFSVKVQEMESGNSYIRDYLCKYILKETQKPEPIKRALTINKRPIRSTKTNDCDASISKCERAILSVLAQYPHGRSRAQIAILSGYSIKSSGFSNALSALRTRGWITGGRECTQITEEGLSALGPYDPLPTGQDLLEHWLGRLVRCEREVLRVLADAYPGTLIKDEIAGRSNYSVNSSGFSNALSKLRTLELISGRQDIRASDVFFE